MIKDLQAVLITNSSFNSDLPVENNFPIFTIEPSAPVHDDISYTMFHQQTIIPMNDQSNEFVIVGNSQNIRNSTLSTKQNFAAKKSAFSNKNLNPELSKMS